MRSHKGEQKPSQVRLILIKTPESRHDQEPSYLVLPVARQAIDLPPFAIASEMAGFQKGSAMFIGWIVSD